MPTANNPCGVHRSHSFPNAQWLVHDDREVSGYDGCMSPDYDRVLRLAEELLSAGCGADELLRRMSSNGAAPSDFTSDVGDALVDLDRQRRCGFPEVVYAPGKSNDALEQIFRALLARGHEVLCTRTSADQAAALALAFPQARYHAVARTLRVPVAERNIANGSPAFAARGKSDPSADRDATTTADVRIGFVAVLTAGTSDLPVAEEARETLDWMRVNAKLIRDVGVAGPHRLRERLAEFIHADAVVVAAGMEGALPSVVGGYVSCPVIGVPTSVGYGANFGGLSALLSMLNSCAANVTVVNIDAGFKAGYVAGMIARRAHAADLRPAVEPNASHPPDAMNT